MPAIQESVVIRRPPEAVFDYLSRAANLAVWDASVVNAEQIGSAPTAVGSRSHGTSKFMGRRFHWTTEVTAFDPPRHFGFRSVEGSLTFTVTTVLDPVDGGTHLTYRSETVSGRRVTPRARRRGGCPRAHRRELAPRYSAGPLGGAA